MIDLSCAPSRKATPRDARAYKQQAIAQATQGRLVQAAASIKKAIHLEPGSAEVHNILGNILFCQGRHDHAVASYQHALSLNPEFAEAYNNLANTLTALGRCEEAVSNCRHALRLRPDYARGYNNLGAALAELNRLDEAVANYRQALRLKPDYADAYCNLGRVLIKQSNWNDAAALWRQALRIHPWCEDAYYRLGGALGEQGRVEEADNCFQEALQLNPDFAEAHWALAFSRLLQGDFEQGWTKFEWRWRLKEFARGYSDRPLWDGSSLAGRTILLRAEQGLGDTIQFVRYAAVVKQYGGTVMAVCQKVLLPLFGSCPGIDRLVAPGSKLSAIDVQAPLMSLPQILRTSLATVPAEIPYLFADAKLKDKWQRKLSRYRGFKIGIAWQGSTQYQRDRLRSIPLARFAPLARMEGVCLISLQKGKGTEQLGEVADQFRVIDLSSELDKGSGAFMDTAAVMKNLDLVVTSDTAIAHLAGALGVPVWVALSFVPDWRWLLQREDSPWYPSMQLFRQTKPGDWNGVFERMAEKLSERLRANRRPLLTEISPGELIDKITILEIKIDKIRAAAKLRNVHAELQSLQAVRARDIGQSRPITRLTSELRAVNERLWQVEDEIRLCEQAKDFGPGFIELARSVYQQNDRRSALKRRINELLGSRIVEEKSYAGREWGSPECCAACSTPAGQTRPQISLQSGGRAPTI